jgi:hypothetical protein
VDAALLVSITISLVRRRPFSLQYASGETGGRVWPLPLFLRVNYVISATWAAAFLAMTLADTAVTFWPVPLDVGVAVSIIALAFGITLTLRYPMRQSARLS